MSTSSSEWREPGYRSAQALPSESGYIRGRDTEPIPGLIKRLADDVTTLFAKELALLKAETTAAVRDVKTGIGSMASGGAVTFAGVLFLLVAAMLGLAQVMEMWLAALIVGGVVTLIGVILLMSGKKKLDAEAFKPRHTAASLRKDRDMVKGEMAHEQQH